MRQAPWCTDPNRPIHSSRSFASYVACSKCGANPRDPAASHCYCECLPEFPGSLVMPLRHQPWRRRSWTLVGNAVIIRPQEVNMTRPFPPRSSHVLDQTPFTITEFE